MSEQDKFEKWLQRYDPDQSLTLAADFPHYASYVTCMIAVAWQAALSTRKSYGYVVVDKNGRFMSAPYIVKDDADDEVSAWNESDSVFRPFRVVELFYEDSES